MANRYVVRIDTFLGTDCGGGVLFLLVPFPDDDNEQIVPPM